MTPLLLIRHGPTEWNAEGRIQGWTDVPLSAEGRAAVGRWAAPEETADWRWVASPLSRAVETARLLVHEPVTDPRLREMNYGDWEGLISREVRVALGDRLEATVGRGLDFRPPGGESPRELQARLHPWLAEVAAARTPTVAVLHNGVIRAIYSLATGWDMVASPPEKLAVTGVAHRFDLATDGAPRVVRMNIPLAAAEAP